MKNKMTDNQQRHYKTIIISIQYWAIILICYFASTNISHAANNDTIHAVYISLQGENSIVVYHLNAQKGTLEKKYTESVNGGPASIAVDPTKKYLYVARRSAKAISAYRIDQASGQLTLINSIMAADNPVYLSTDKSGKYLLSAYFGANKAAVYPISIDGSLIAKECQLITTGSNPHALMTDPTNKFLYITNMTGNKIMQNQFNALSGTFTSLDPAEVIPPSGTGPRHMVFHGSKNALYVVNETGNSITAYIINPISGVLSSFQTISTIPFEYKGTNKCADIHITPDNRFLYASNRGHQSIAAFHIDAKTDSLISIAYYTTVSSPREFDIDANGKYLYAAGESSNDLAIYHIDSKTGELELMDKFNVGKNPTWVHAVQLVNFSSSTNDQLPIKANNLELWNSPNPFVKTTSISFAIVQPSKVKLSICDISGNMLSVLVNKNLKAGTYNINCIPELSLLKPGIYFCSLETNMGIKVIKLIKKQGY